MCTRKQNIETIPEERGREKREKEKEKDEDDELMVLKEKEAKECVAYYRRDLTSITFCLVSLDRKRAVCTRHQGILMTCHNNPTIERKFRDK